MNILFIAPESHQSIGITRAFEKAGHRVVFLHQRVNYLVPRFLSRSQFLWTLMIKHSQALKMKNKALFNRRILEICRREKINMLFTAPKGTTIQRETLSELRSRGVKSAVWFTENLHHPLYKKWVEEHHGDWDVFFTFDSQSSYGPYLPMGLDTAFYRGENESGQYDCEVCFIGARYPEREELLRAVARMGVRLKIFGWRDWEKSDLAPYYCRPLAISHIADTYRRARINLNSNLRPTQGSVNLKTFEIPASGGFELCDNQRDLPDLFEIGKEIAVYASNDDMIEKIRYYLDHEGERETIARAGRARVLRDHTLDKRIETILATIA